MNNKGNIKTQIESQIKELSENKSRIQSGFNTLLLGMVNHIALKYTNTTVSKYHATIKQFFEDKPAEPLSLFIVHVYDNDEYRNKIKEGDEDFFMNQSISSENTDITSKIFEFKEYWKTFDSDTKKHIKKVMNSLVQRAETYICLLSDLSKLKKMLNN